MASLYLVGAGTVACEILEFACQISHVAPWDIKGLLDDDEDKVGTSLAGFPVVSTLEKWAPKSDDVAICTIGDPLIRDEIKSRLNSLRVHLATLIHPLSYVAPSATIGAGSIVYPFAQISSSAVVGSNVMINYSASVGHHASVGDSTVISAHVDITGSVTVGTRAFLGSHATVAPSLSIGDDARVAMGSAVLASVAPQKRVLGVPARSYDL